MPFVLELLDKSYVAVQGAAVVMNGEEVKSPLLVIETWKSMIPGLLEMFEKNPILNVLRLSEIVPGFNEVILRGEAGEQQISSYSFDKAGGLGLDRIRFVEKPTV